MLIGIEGTGSQTWGQTDLRRTFVRRVLDQAAGPSWYFIGPNLMGSDGPAIMDGAWAILQNYARKRALSEPIHLVGYSRGAAYCIELCYRMLDLPVERRRINTLILFDAVDRQPNIRADQIPANVDACFHAYRDPRVGSRNYFKNCGLYRSQSNAIARFRFEKQPFMATHGGMGGVPWHAQVGPNFKPLAATIKDAAKNPPTAIQALKLLSRQAAMALHAAHIGIEGYAWYCAAEGEFDDRDVQALWVWLKNAGADSTFHNVVTIPFVTRVLLQGDRGELETDRDLLNIAQTPKIGYFDDRNGSQAVGKWMWQRLAALGIVPDADGYLKLAPPASLNLSPGQPLRVH